MSRDLILGTAGHIDHGKTALVKALTGTDCDRLPEEKRRGITIDIGFTTLDLGDFRLGIVDVPGHERFVRNMLAGATGIDLALLVVAADDSVMPQTREHFEILRLLGIRQGLIALTKCDLVDATTLEVVELEVRELVKDSFLEAAPIVPTSAHTGQGLAELRAAIAGLCQGSMAADSSSLPFRLSIDRSFIVQRAAINLAGVHHENVQRGQDLAAPGYLLPARTLTVRLHCLADARRALKHRAPVRFHIGTAEVMAVVSLLDADRIEPGGWGMAQLFLEEPAMAAWGQPFIVRESAGTHTLGGGQVLQPAARKVKRKQPDILARFERLWSGDATERAGIVAWQAGLGGITPMDLARGAGASPGEAAAILRRLLDQGQLVEVGAALPGDALVQLDIVKDLEDRVLSVMRRLHAQTPFAPGHERQKVLAPLSYLGNDGLIDFIIDRMRLQKRLVGDAQRVALADFKPKLSVNLLKLKDKVVAAYQEAGLRPPRAASFAAQAGGNAANLNDLFQLCVAEGHLVYLDEDYYLDQRTAEQTRQRLAERLKTAVNGMTVADIRDLLGTGRKQAMLICQYLDRIGMTRREGDLRFLAQT